MELCSAGGWMPACTRRVSGWSCTWAVHVGTAVIKYSFASQQLWLMRASILYLLERAFHSLGIFMLRNGPHLQALWALCLINGSRLWNMIVHGQTQSFTTSSCFFFVLFFVLLLLWQAEDDEAVSDLFESILEHFLAVSHMALSWNRTHVSCATCCTKAKRLSQKLHGCAHC